MFIDKVLFTSCVVIYFSHNAILIVLSLFCIYTIMPIYSVTIHKRLKRVTICQCIIQGELYECWPYLVILQHMICTYYDMNLILYRLFTIVSTIDQSSATGEKGSKFDSSRDRYV